MRLLHASALAVVAAALLVPAVPGAQQQQDANRKVAGGGIMVPGWQGMIDPRDKTNGESINNSKFAADGNAFHLTVGPASVYWNPKNVATGSYTVKANFYEPKQLNDHAHPYGVFIAGKNLDSPTQEYLYCAAYGTGTYIVRGFNGATVVQYSGRRGVAHDAISKFGADGSVRQEVAIRVTPDQVSCLVNGTAVASYPKSEIVAAGKLSSTDGIFGIRSAHNTDVVVTNFGMTKN
jgi:hypothetical protein